MLSFIACNVYVYGQMKYTETKSVGQKTWHWKGALNAIDTANGINLIVTPRHIIISKVPGQQ